MLLCCALSEEELHTKNDKIELLIEKLSENDMHAMDQLYALIKTDVYAFALAKSQNPQDAEDILQDTFVQIYKYACRYQKQGKPLAWIFTIVMSLANRRFQVNSRYAPLDESFEEAPGEQHFETTVENQEFLKQLMSILDASEQEIITLHIVSGLKHAEIAKLLGKPLSTVLSKYHRAIKKLQSNLKEAW